MEFFVEYADRAQHGKEEQIFFRDLGRRELMPAHRKLIGVLTAEHARARKHVQSLGAAAKAGGRDEEKARERMIDDLAALVELYPLHIAKEDADRFFPAMGYFTEREQLGMLREFENFDRKLIHERYEKLVRRWSRE